MRNIRIDFANLVRQLLPDHKRQFVRLRMLQAFVKPLADVFSLFDQWRDQTRKLLNVTNQKGVLEWYLRDKYGASEITIESYRQAGFGIGLRSEGVGAAQAIGSDRNEGTPVSIPLRGEQREQFGDIDFIVYIPLSVDQEQVRADAEKYRAGLTSYKIVQQ